MTRFTVAWTASALDDVAEAWLQSRERDAVTSASHAIDKQLHFDADKKGEEEHEGLRSLVIAPLKAYFEANTADRLVVVFRIRAL